MKLSTGCATNNDLYRWSHLCPIAWVSYAQEAGIGRHDEFAQCLQDKRPMRRIEAGRTIAEEMEVNATPTVLLNGWRFGRPPPPDSLVQAIGRILDGQAAFKAVRE
jgi:predicted DsbA family dithiol-disulfide isomerase